MTGEQAAELGGAWLDASTNDNDLIEINHSGEFPGQLPGEITKTKSFKWRCGGGTLLGYSWSYYSTEIDGLKKATSTSPWQLVSFAHQNISWVGSAHGNVSLSTNSAIASVVSGNLAEIKIDWDVVLTMDCLGATIFSSPKNHSNYAFFRPNDVP